MLIPQKETPPLNQIVSFIYDLPLNVLKDYGIFLDTKNSKKLFEAVVEQYQAKGLWLAYFLLDQKQLLYQIENSSVSFYKPLAEQAIAFYKLSQHAMIYSHVLRELYPSSGFLLLGIELDMCEKMLISCGLLGKPNPKPKSKFYSDIKQLADSLTDVEKYKDNSSGFATSFQNHLLNEAANLAIEHGKFRVYWRRFLQDVKRTGRDIERNPHLTVGYLDNDQIKRIGTGKRKKQL